MLDKRCWESDAKHETLDKRSREEYEARLRLEAQLKGVQDSARQISDQLKDKDEKIRNQKRDQTIQVRMKV